MTNNDLISSLEYNSPLDYLILTPLVSLLSLCASFEAGLLHSLGTLTLINIYHKSIMKSSVMKPHTLKEVESPVKFTQNMLAYMGI